MRVDRDPAMLKTRESIDKTGQFAPIECSYQNTAGLPRGNQLRKRNDVAVFKPPDVLLKVFRKTHLSDARNVPDDKVVRCQLYTLGFSPSMMSRSREPV